MAGARLTADLADRSADPANARAVLDQLGTTRPDLAELLRGESELGAAVVAVAAASRAFGNMVLRSDAALTVLEDLDRRPPLVAGNAKDLVVWKQHELLRIAARDLLGHDTFEQTVAAISGAAADVLNQALRLADATELAVVAMGKLGGNELNYASDVDIMLIGRTGNDAELRAARRFLAIAGRCWPIDTALRPEGRDGALLRSPESYRTHWQRWAEPWEFQALIKARPVAGDAELGARFERLAADSLWSRQFDAEDLRTLRAMKGRTERLVDRQPTGARELKRGPGGIRDIEFSLQILQLVHGRHDERLRTGNTLDTLGALTSGGYVDGADGDWLRWGYRFLRRIEHLLQIDGDRSVTTVPASATSRRRLARLMGFQDTPRAEALEEFDSELAACRGAVRQIHSRLYFRPLLEAFAHSPGPLDSAAAVARLAAFGFADAERTRQAVEELTRGLSRSSQLMRQLMPVVLDWLSTTPDPDAGLLGLRSLASGTTRSLRLANAFRESPETAQRLCRVLGTSPKLTGLVTRNPDLINQLGVAQGLRDEPTATLADAARAAIDLRSDPADRQRALHRFTDREGFRIGALDVLDLADTQKIGHSLARLAESAVRIALEQAQPSVPLAVLALGRLGGRELSYASDLDLVFVHGGEGEDDQTEAERATLEILHFLQGETPSALIYDLDLDLRPEGRNGPVVRSLDSYTSYFDRWAQTWERQAHIRVRAIAGDVQVGDQLLSELEPHVWQPLTTQHRTDVRRMKARIEAERLPVGEDPTFHLKLGPGAMADVEFCTQLLQLEHGVRGTSTLGALHSLAATGAVERPDTETLIEAYRFCETTRNRCFLVKGAPSDALPQGTALSVLARSFNTTAPELRDHYRRVTRRARRVVERLFYDQH